MKYLDAECGNTPSDDSNNYNAFQIKSERKQISKAGLNIPTATDIL